MVPFNILVLVALGYVALLFLVAFVAEEQARRGRFGWLRSPMIYTLSLSIYCTAWTFYGAVGYAARSGLEFVTIYLGPTLVMVGWWWLLRKLVRIGRTQRITSIADLISSRYGKSNALGVVVTLLAVLGTTPYIALQLQSVTLSFTVFATDAPEGWSSDTHSATALWVAAGLALFTVLFGTRNIDANERHPGVVTAIAVEAVVKLVALLAVGIFVVWYVAGGPRQILEMTAASPIAQWDLDATRWISFTFLSGAAFLCLPRMFHVLVVENPDERHLAVASWAFPFYLFLMSLFVIPIAVVGLTVLPAGENPDMFVLTVPLAYDREALAMLSFLGGFSSATSMVIVAAIALSTMVSNHVVMPLWLSLEGNLATLAGDVRRALLISRRVTIAVILFLGYLYLRISGGGAALAAIGLISFVGVVQVLPALVGGIFWRGATRIGAMAGLLGGFVIWAWTLFLPSIGESGLLSQAVLAEGPWGIEWLRPTALFGLEGYHRVVHALLWSMSVNTALFVGCSLLSFPRPIERMQGAQFVNIFERSPGTPGWSGSGGEAEDLLVMSQRIIGGEDAQALFRRIAAEQGKAGYLPDVTPDFIDRLERELAGSVGAATAHAMLGQIVGGSSVSVEDLMAVAGETAQIMEYSSQLEAKSTELERTARQLREANEKLTQLSIQKDAFLSQISHELRTPMTSIRAFSEILLEADRLSEADLKRYAGIIQEESLRLTRLLDNLLDLSVLENGSVSLELAPHTLRALIRKSVAASASSQKDRPLEIRRDPVSEEIDIETDGDRLSQVFINLIANAGKYCDSETPRLEIAARVTGSEVVIDFVDNGSGIPEESQALIFEKFSRLSDQAAAGGAGLGLAICREIMAKLGGSITYLPGQGGAAFRVSLPQRVLDRAAE